ncbi:hypothetical protein PoB_004454700 [Plakobranchus ocellatus]|uniref:Uncharacterized protein n=1 Tax=Plakobranchus ocellatus TaxID=259542 RepID=A0AAV4BFK5_9GAST|nr:hypothetical protein PoB_004454700 [Plakobranchus ocellatus]
MMPQTPGDAPDTHLNRTGPRVSLMRIPWNTQDNDTESLLFPSLPVQKARQFTDSFILKIAARKGDKPATAKARMNPETDASFLWGYSYHVRIHCRYKDRFKYVINHLKQDALLSKESDPLPACFQSKSLQAAVEV